MSQNRVRWSVLESAEHAQLEQRWNSIYGSALSTGQRHWHGVRAEAKFLEQSADQFVIVPFLNQRRRTAAYFCHGDLLPLGQFCAIDFFVSPPDLAWTMIHTHEDFDLFGPYFVDRACLVDDHPDPRRSGAASRRRRRQ